MINIMIIALVIAFFLAIICIIFKKNPRHTAGNAEEDRFSLTFLKTGIGSLFNEILNQNIAELYLNKSDTKKREQQKARLNTALRSCAQGNRGEKAFVKDYIKDLLQARLGVDEVTINEVLPFEKPSHLTEQDMFEILYRQLAREHPCNAWEPLSKLCGFEREKTNEYGSYYEITGEDIRNAFAEYAASPSYIEKLEIVTQRIFQELYGFAVADILRDDMSIDSIEGGVSGAATQQYNYMEEVFQTGGIRNPRTCDSLWIFFHGKAIHLSFLSFGTQSELIRVCKNLCRYDNVGHLTSSNGYKLTYLYDGSRVVVVRPKLASQWAFFVRKFESSRKMTIRELISDPGKEAVVELLKWAVKGCLNIIISGDQNSGKTTCLKALGIFFDQRNPIRTTEPEFETWFNNVYDYLNCVCFRGSDEVSINEAITIQKKTEAAVMILGEVNSSELADAFISLCQSGTKSSMCTCHCISTEEAVDYFRNSIMASGTFRNEKIAEEQVSNSIHLDIHWEKLPSGHRYISYINEIEPLPRDETRPADFLASIAESLKRLSNNRTFVVRPIITIENGRYSVKNTLSGRSANRIFRNLAKEDKKEFLDFCNNSFA